MFLLNLLHIGTPRTLRMGGKQRCLRHHHCWLPSRTLMNCPNCCQACSPRTQRDVTMMMATPVNYSAAWRSDTTPGRSNRVPVPTEALNRIFMLLHLRDELPLQPPMQ